MRPKHSQWGGRSEVGGRLLHVSETPFRERGTNALAIPRLVGVALSNCPSRESFDGGNKGNRYWLPSMQTGGGSIQIRSWGMAFANRGTKTTKEKNSSSMNDGMIQIFTGKALNVSNVTFTTVSPRHIPTKQSWPPGQRYTSRHPALQCRTAGQRFSRKPPSAGRRCPTSGFVTGGGAPATLPWRNYHVNIAAGGKLTLRGMGSFRLFEVTKSWNPSLPSPGKLVHSGSVYVRNFLPNRVALLQAPTVLPPS